MKTGVETEFARGSITEQNRRGILGQEEVGNRGNEFDMRVGTEITRFQTTEVSYNLGIFKVFS